MALSHYGLASQCSRVVWIIVMLLSETFTRETQNLYMYIEGQNPKCETETYLIGGATVYSHYGRHQDMLYSHHIDCCITFQAEINWKVMLRIVDIDIPDKSYSLCNDALYVYDADDIFGQAVAAAGGTSGLCGNQLPSTIFSTGPFLTVCFRTDRDGPRGKGFKYVVSAFHEEHNEVDGCSTGFACGNRRCIDPELTCDRVDHCGDFSDEQTLGGANCGQTDDSLLGQFLALGITAAIAITVGSVVVFVVCVVCIICCCCRCMKKEDQDPGGGGCTTTTTTATSVTINNGAPPLPMGHSPYHQVQGYAPQGYYPMHHLQGPGSMHGPTPLHGGHSSIYGSAHGGGQSSVHGSAHGGPPGSVHRSAHAYSPLPQRESYSQGSGYSSQPPPSYHRSYTPTSSHGSRSGKSHHSGESGVRYQLQMDKEKVSLPVHL